MHQKCELHCKADFLYFVTFGTAHDEPEQTGCSKIRGVWLLWCDVMIRLSSYHRFRFVVSTGERSVITLTPLCTTSNGVNPVYFEGLDFSFDGATSEYPATHLHVIE